jgi:DNA-binding transcriptional regulator YbjK
MDQPPPSPRMLALLDAGVTVVAHQGLRGLTHRAVDREAGLPEGSCSAYLRTRLALLTALTEYVAARFAADVRNLAGRLDGHHETEVAARETAAMFRSWLEHPELLQTRLELSLEGQRQPEIARVSAAWGRELVTIVEGILDRAGDEHAADRADTLTAAMDGVLVRALREPPQRRTAFLERSLDLLISSLVDARD